MPPFGTWMEPSFSSKPIHSLERAFTLSKFFLSMRTTGPGGGFLPKVGDLRSTRFTEKDPARPRSLRLRPRPCKPSPTALVLERFVESDRAALCL